MPPGPGRHISRNNKRLEYFPRRSDLSIVGRGSIYLACLAVLLSGSLILVPQPAEADPYRLQVENTLSANKNQIEASDWWAHSFVPTVIFQVSCVSLYVRDQGSGGPSRMLILRQWMRSVESRGRSRVRTLLRWRRKD